MVKEKYAVEYAQSRWINKIINKSNDFARKLIKDIEFDPDNLNKYIIAKNIINNNEKNENLYSQEMGIINRFESKYSKELIDSKEFKWLLIQQEWINRIPGKSDIQQYFIKNAIIVSGTCTGVVSNRAINDMVFDYVIIDEAAKATFPELLISIIRAKKIIMVGDHKQLPPVLDKDLIDKSIDIFKESNLDSGTLYDSIFMNLFENLPNENKQILSTQYRMHPVIGTMISQVFYDNAISNGVPSSSRTHPIECYRDKAIIWIDTSNCPERYEESVSTSFSNLFEANIVKEQLKIIDEGNKDSDLDVGVITGYSAQKNLIQKVIQPVQFKNLSEKVSVNTVDAFQGGQKDIIIYSTVKSNKKKKSIGHLKSKERLNVAFSRAKRLLIIVGDSNFLNNITIQENLFPKIIKYVKDNDQYCEIIDYNNLTEKH
ncbi:hypothetical protein BSK56_33545 [Paenibacillus borealis]|uniref:DNA helicase n=6 Tax=Paenibacillus TaxID=44249 RepID=A0ABX3GQ17_PAEBO|nr:hypothetical protein BSK56_33545 [Paenibacillus borealis]